MKKNNDILGRIMFKMFYLKIDISSFCCTLINKAIWQIKGVQMGKKISYYGFSRVSRFPYSSITIGEGCTFRSDKVSNLIGVNRQCIISTHKESAVISIGNHCGFSGASVGCLQSITIGNDVLVGANVIITDFDWHNLNPLRRKEKCTSAKPVVIDNNVFIGANSIILKGVTIGYNTVIGANSVVTTSIPPNCIAAGNPARIVKENAFGQL